MTGPPAGARPGGVRPAVAIGPADVGARVVVRRERPDARPGEPPLGDVLGHLVSWADGVLVLRTRDGRTVPVALDAVVAAKRIPEAPTRRRSGDT